MFCFECRRLSCALIVLLFAMQLRAEKVADNWHQWRGPDATGVSRTASPPLKWNEAANLNIKWKVPIEGKGGSSPIIWGDRVFLLTAVDTQRIDDAKLPPEDQKHKNPFGIKYPNTYFQYVVLCIDRTSGKPLWRRVAAEQVPIEGHHRDNDYASSSPTTDGKHLYCWFGSAGFHCYTLDGDFVWKRDFGPAKTRLSFGEASSPTVHEGKVILTRDQEEQSAITVMDAKTGTTIWKNDRDEPSCWATPIVVEHDGVDQLITNGHNRVRSYNLDDGSLIWECGGQVSNVTPSPVSDGKSVYCMSGYRGSAAFGVALDATGDVTDSENVRWQLSKNTPYVPSPMLYDGLLFFNQTNRAVMTCVDAVTGNVLISPKHMEGLRGMYASPVGAKDRVYYVGRNGATLVLKKDREFVVLAKNELDEPIDASPALAGSDLFLRSESSLYCLSESTQ